MQVNRNSLLISHLELMTEESTHKIFSSLANRGLMCIHRMKIIHHDLKSANCLVSKHWTVKICDFGLSRITTDEPIKSSSGGTPEWMAPEVIRKEPFTEKCDIFSLGVIIWELYTLNRPWDGMPPDRVCHNSFSLHLHQFCFRHSSLSPTFCPILGCSSRCKRGFATGDASRACGQVDCRYKSR